LDHVVMRKMHEGLGYSRRIEDDPAEGRILLNVSASLVIEDDVHCRWLIRA